MTQLYNFPAKTHNTTRNAALIRQSQFLMRTPPLPPFPLDYSTERLPDECSPIAYK